MSTRKNDPQKDSPWHCVDSCETVKHKENTEFDQINIISFVYYDLAYMLHSFQN